MTQTPSLEADSPTEMTFVRPGSQTPPQSQIPPSSLQSPSHTMPDGSDVTAPAGSSFSDTSSPATSDGQPSSSSATTGESRTSSRVDPAIKAQVKDAFEDLGEDLVRYVGFGLHRNLARDEISQFLDLFLTDEEDGASIGRPLGRVINRRIDISSLGADGPDVLQIIVGVARYSRKQFDKIREWGKMRRTGAAVNGPQPGLAYEPEEPEGAVYTQPPASQTFDTASFLAQ